MERDILQPTRLLSNSAALVHTNTAIDAGGPGIGAGPQPDTPAPPTGSTRSNTTSLVTGLGEITNISDQDYDGGACESVLTNLSDYVYTGVVPLGSIFVSGSLHSDIVSKAQTPRPQR